MIENDTKPGRGGERIIRDIPITAYKSRPPRTQDRDVQTMDLKLSKIRHTDRLLANLFTRAVDVPDTVKMAVPISVYDEEAT